MRRHFATFALGAPARAGAVDATVNIKAAVDIIHTMSTATLVVLHAVLVSAVGVAWALRPQNTHGSAFGPAKSQAKMQPRDLPVRATTLCKTNKTRVMCVFQSNNQTKSKRNARHKAKFKPQTNPMALLKATIKRNKTESKRNARNKAKLKPQTHITASFKVNTNN